ncbi:hypothetical protein ZYGR_0A04600 [Zygosaccharomyces rouxii]|uniref:Ureidoglycolate lyase n=2 Tax=Zygosaccharomyces rouxii TaxID=4956 RepID=C5DQC6_ZYGRC|nr:uncharacterized protein ZYRO0A10406g [Zygosaccharomyces rouxii]KAH9198594.1 ureidoglycolate hydrolase [Zygosaccharomyces rouxii]GAV46862.1 hypothetical protein ZYGR_0A04600 [Zygosaccharomyces rouxii]CAR25887.1 ZYRO0A10406p [Zygosaccharomyces rouxii]
MTSMIAEALTIESFAPYGSIISPDEEISKLDESAKNANQGTAIKLLKRSKVENPLTQQVPNWNLFRCFSQPHLKISLHAKDSTKAATINHSIRVLEKHPYSSQTFLPMGCSSQEFGYLVVVALENPETKKPDISTARAFLCKGNQAVTYGAGVWHAPMIVVGAREYIDFGVLIYELLDPNAPEKDCMECFYGASDLLVTMYTS